MGGLAPARMRGARWAGEGCRIRLVGLTRRGEDVVVRTTTEEMT
jgi:hypothetical protein